MLLFPAELSKRFAYGMITGHCKINLLLKSSLGFSRIFSSLALASLLLSAHLTPGYSQAPGNPRVANKLTPGAIVAQGRLQPTKGILKLSVLPGDRIEKILVEAGAEVIQDQRLLELESARLKKLEIEVAELRLAEARTLYESSLREAQLAIDAADLKLRSAQQVQRQAQTNLELVSKQGQILQSLDSQIQRLEAIRDNPRLKGAVGSLEIEAKRNQKINTQAEYDRSHLAASQAIESAADLVAQAESLVQSAKQSKSELESNPGYRSLEKQIELLRLQLELATLIAPSPGTILQISAIAGERTATSPVIELADLSQMSCVAEVHEADIGQIQIGQMAELKSASLSRAIRGKVNRIDRVVGAPQIRSANPLARSDFRSVPVWIQIDPEDVPVASQRVQLQVEVSITP